MDDSPKNYADIAYWIYVALALIVCVAFALQIHLQTIDAGPEVVGAALFLGVIWLGLPALALVIVGTFLALKSFDKQLLSLSLVFVVLGVAFALSLSLVYGLEALYILLVVVFGILRLRKRRKATMGSN